MNTKIEELVRVTNEETGRSLLVNPDRIDIAKHWCRGNDNVQTCNPADPDHWEDMPVDPENANAQWYIDNGWGIRIKKRDPKVGEIWVCYTDRIPVYWLICSHGQAVSLINYYQRDLPQGAKYSDPSLEALYARKHLKGLGDKNHNMSLDEMQTVLNRIIESCQFGD